MLRLPTPPRASDEGLPLANGLLGALIWGDGAPLTISLDRTDLWDLREIPDYHAADYRWADVVEKHRTGAHAELIERLEAPYARPGPTKIPAGRIELVIDGAVFEALSLDPLQPVGVAALGSAEVRVLVHAVDPVGVIWIDNSDVIMQLAAPAFGGKPDDWVAPTGFDASHADVWALGYPSPVRADGDGVQAFVQHGHDGFAFAVVLAWQPRGSGVVGAWSIATSNEGADPLALARARANAALAANEATLLARHAAWWADYWAQSQIDVPDALIARHHALDMYKFGAAARAGAPPISLQGPWTVDNGRLPPWKGDYHHDLNTQMSYWPALAAGHVDAHAAFLDWLIETRDACRAWTRQFFEVDGLNVPMTADLLNRQIGGWRQYTHSLASGAWLAHHFYQHWRYTFDQSFLADKAYPYVAEVCTFIDAISHARDEHGHRSVALSSSPEIHNNAPEAWFDRFTNYDLAMFRHALTIAADMAETLGLAEADRWRRVCAELPPLAISEDGVLAIAPGEVLAASHRHFSHLAAIFPLGDIDPAENSADMAIARASIAQLDNLGSGMWMGYSFAWLACLKARIGDGAGASRALHGYIDGFLLPNSFHANGDFANKGYSNAVFRAFTLEGNFGAAQAVHEMLLQSHGGIIRLFPAIPDDWSDTGFTGLLAEGAIRVSAKRSKGRLIDVLLESPVSQDCTLALGFAGLPFRVPLSPDTVTRLDKTALQQLENLLPL